MEVMNYEKWEEENVVVHRKTTNIKEGILHEVITYEGCMSLEVQRSHNNEYNLFKSVKLDDPSIKKMEEIVNNFIM